MKNRIILMVLFALMFIAFNLSAQKTIITDKFKKKHTASISKVALYKNSKSNKIEPNFLWSQFDATKRSSVIVIMPDENGDAKLRVLAENTPDAAIESISKITNSAKFKDQITAESVVEISRSIAQIKRSSVVENFRTLSYRIAELTNNDGTLNPDAKSLLEQLIKGAVETSKYDNDLTKKEFEVSKIKYEANLQEQKNKAKVLEKYEAELENETDDAKKKEILSKMAEIVGT